MIRDYKSIKRYFHKRAFKIDTAPMQLLPLLALIIIAVAHETTEVENEKASIEASEESDIEISENIEILSSTESFVEGNWTTTELHRMMKENPPIDVFQEEDDYCVASLLQPRKAFDSFDGFIDATVEKLLSTNDLGEIKRRPCNLSQYKARDYCSKELHNNSKIQYYPRDMFRTTQQYMEANYKLVFLIEPIVALYSMKKSLYKYAKLIPQSIVALAEQVWEEHGESSYNQVFQCVAEVALLYCADVGVDQVGKGCTECLKKGMTGMKLPVKLSMYLALYVDVTRLLAIKLERLLNEITEMDYNEMIMALVTLASVKRPK